MAYGSVLTDVVQSSTAGTPPQFNDGNGTQTGTLCRAWVKFTGSGSAVISSSFNVSSVTRTNSGRYTVSFTTAFSDTNYVVTFGSGTIYQQCALDVPSTGSMTVYSVLIDPTSAGGYQDSGGFHIHVTR